MAITRRTYETQKTFWLLLPTLVYDCELDAAMPRVKLKPDNIQCNKFDTLQDKWPPSRAGKQYA